MRHGWLMALGLAGACAGTRAEPPKDTTELEARVARFEALLAPDAGSSQVDGPEVVVDDADGSGVATVVSPPDASVFVDAAVVASPPSRAERVARCLANVEQGCRRQGASERVEGPVGDGGFAWIHVELPPSASATPAGRKCLEQARVRCQQYARFGQQEDELFAWLDGQLAPGQIDRAFSEKVRQALEKTGRVHGTVQVACTARFCRVHDDLDAGVPMAGFAVRSAEPQATSGGDLTVGNGSTYVTRSGYRFPR